MAGLYIHIPFCRQACNYCNFHFSTSSGYYDQMVQALCKELEMRKEYIGAQPLETIYFGGGTPSILPDRLLMQLFETIHKHYDTGNVQEVTLEANPDDLTENKLQFLSSTPVNRFSIGVQSFFDEDLVWMNRAHKAAEAERCIKLAQDKGFNLLTIDLIYGTPGLSNERWLQNLQKAVDLGLEHISSYALTLEPGTALDHLVKKHKTVAPAEEQAAEQFDILVDTLEANGFEQYEISNFARNKRYALHNTNYWKNKIYSGIGPSAHSFDHHTRSWNIANNSQYMSAIEQGHPLIETEYLTPANRLNEYIMTGLRTIWGCDIDHMKKHFDAGMVNEVLDKISGMTGQLEISQHHFKLKRAARVFADGIAASLFVA